MDRCPRCGAGSLVTVPGPHPGGHHAKLVCDRCGRFVKWLPRPQTPRGELPAGVVARIHPRTRPAVLEGTEAQRRFARSLRAALLHNLGFLGRTELVALVKCVVDATWFLANKGRSPNDLRWPAEWQMEPASPSGTCCHCSDPTYTDDVCSEECGDAVNAALCREHDGRERSAGWIDL